MHTKQDYNLKICWNFFEVSYKGTVDPVGGISISCVMGGCLDLKTPQQFAGYADGIVQNIYMIQLPGKVLAYIYRQLRMWKVLWKSIS